MLDLSELQTTERWTLPRLDAPFKLNNAHHFEKFYQTVHKLAPEYPVGTLKYNKLSRYRETPGIAQLEFEENSPIFHFWKVAPFAYNFQNFKPDDIWKRWDVDHTIYDRLSQYDNNKYAQGPNIYEFDEPFILFALQSNSGLQKRSFNTETFIRCIMWAEANKRHIIFKQHPYAHKNKSHILQQWNSLKERGIIKKYAHIVGSEYNIDNLIDRCDALWTFCSGAGFQALIKKKPVVQFWHRTEYNALSTFCKLPEEAAQAKGLSADEQARYISWYFDRFCINSEAPDFEDKLRARFDLVYKDYETDLYKIFGPVGTSHV